MRKRNRRLDVRLNDGEEIKLNNLMLETGLNASQLVRSMILQTEIRTRPLENLPKLLRELNAIGNNINQIARKSNAFDTVSQAEISEIRKMLSDVYREVKG